MSCENVNGFTLALNGGLVAAMAIAGVVTACVVTAGAVSTIILAAGIFATPALVMGAAFLGDALCSHHSQKNYSQLDKDLFFITSGILFALSSIAIIAWTVLLGVLSPAFIVPFIVAASLPTILLLGWGTASCVQSKI